MEKKIYYGVEFIRFLSALAVVFFHYKAVFAWHEGFVDYQELKKNLPEYNYLSILYNYGFYGVQVFFIISGFVFSHVYLEKSKIISIKEFFVNRFARLYPLHLLILLILCLFYLLDSNFINNYFKIESNKYFDLYHFFLNIFLINSWGFEKGSSFNTPSWSISIEIAVYITFFIFLKFSSLKFRKIFSAVIVLILIIFYKVPFLHFTYSEFVLLFYLGVLLYQLPIRKNFKLFLFLGIFLFISSFFGRNFKILLFCPSILILVILFEDFLKKKIIKNFFRILGNTSYAIYLTHFPLMLFFYL